jgi:serine/threonine-protein kinase
VSTDSAGGDEPISIGRYLLHRQIARGGMATIHLARVLGDVGFSRIVAAKRLRPELAGDREFVAMFLDEARIASKVHHRNVVPVLDVGTSDREVVLVQEYVHGAPLSYLLHATCEARAHVPIPVAVSIACQVLAGLHAAHGTCDELGTPLHIIHRDVSPQNIMVATDGTARLLDFGIAKATARAHITRKGTFKGKLAYAAPEQIRSNATRQSDIFSLAVVLWEMVVGARLHTRAHDDAALIQRILTESAPLVTDELDHERELSGAYRWRQIEALAPIIAKGLAIDARRRWTSAAAMEEALTAAVPLATSGDVVEWLRAVAGEMIAERDRLIASEEAHWRGRIAGTGSELVMTEDLAIPVAASPRLPQPITRLRMLWSRAQQLRAGLRLHRSARLIAGWSALAVMVLLVVVLVTYCLASGGSEPRHDVPPLATPVLPTLPSGQLAPDPPPAMPIATPPNPPAKVRAAPTPPSSAAPARLAVKPRSRPEPLRSAASPPSHGAPAPPTRATAHERTVPAASATAHERAPVAASSARPSAPSAVDCATPYYFEGDKKIFKPACI